MDQSAVILGFGVILILASSLPAHGVATESQLQEANTTVQSEGTNTSVPVQDNDGLALGLVFSWPLAWIGGGLIAYAIREKIDSQHKSGKSLLVYPFCMVLAVTPAIYFLYVAGWGNRATQWYVTTALLGLVAARVVPLAE
jgi:hypothetical protein